MKLNLSKIFNIKPNGGGYKTLKKLMGKYNIPVDEIKDIKKELVKDSSGGDVKSYYYKTTLLNNYMDDDVYIAVMHLYVLGTKIAKLRVYDHNASFYEDVEVAPLTPNVEEIIAIQLIDMIDYQYNYMDWNGEHDVMGIIPRGGIVDKFKYIAEEKGISKEEIQPMIDIVNSMFQEITKEEYESMITYKPE